MGVERDIETEEIIARSRRIKARAEELLREHRLARMTPEARAKWKTLIAGVRQHTRDEERRERQARMKGDLLE